MTDPTMTPAAYARRLLALRELDERMVALQADAYRFGLEAVFARLIDAEAALREAMSQARAEQTGGDDRPP